MVQHYDTILPEDEALVAKTFDSFVERVSPNGRTRTEAIFHCPEGSIPSIGAPYDLLRPLFRATGAVVGGVGHRTDEGGYRVAILSNGNVRTRIEEILAKHQAGTSTAQGIQR